MPNNITLQKISTLVFTLLLIPLLLSVTPVQSSMLGNNTTYVKVTASNGLNIRNMDCSIQDTLPLGTILATSIDVNIKGGGDLPNTINCEIGGKNITLNLGSVSYSDDGIAGFVAPNFVTKLNFQEKIVKNINNYDVSDYIFAVNPNDGLNIRDVNCKMLGALAKDTQVTLKDGESPNTIKCKVNGVQYAMIKVTTQNSVKEGYVASYYLK